MLHNTPDATPASVLHCTPISTLFTTLQLLTQDQYHCSTSLVNRGQSQGLVNGSMLSAIGYFPKTAAMGVDSHSSVPQHILRSFTTSSFRTREIRMYPSSPGSRSLPDGFSAGARQRADKYLSSFSQHCTRSRSKSSKASRESSTGQSRGETLRPSDYTCMQYRPSRLISG